MTAITQEDATELAAMAGITLTAEQEALITAGMRTGSDGKRVQFQVKLPRGQAEVILVRELAGLFLLDERILHVSAGNIQSAGQARKITEIVTGSPELSRRVSRIRRANGAESIRTYQGSEIRFLTSLQARGYAADLLVFGPGADRSSRIIAALIPCLAGRPDPQIWISG